MLLGRLLIDNINSILLGSLMRLSYVGTHDIFLRIYLISRDEGRYFSKETSYILVITSSNVAHYSYILVI